MIRGVQTPRYTDTHIGGSNAPEASGARSFQHLPLWGKTPSQTSRWNELGGETHAGVVYASTHTTVL